MIQNAKKNERQNIINEASLIRYFDHMVSPEEFRAESAQIGCPAKLARQLFMESSPNEDSERDPLQLNEVIDVFRRLATIHGSES